MPALLLASSVRFVGDAAPAPFHDVWAALAAAFAASTPSASLGEELAVRLLEACSRTAVSHHVAPLCCHPALARFHAYTDDCWSSPQVGGVAVGGV